MNPYTAPNEDPDAGCDNMRRIWIAKQAYYSSLGVGLAAGFLWPLVIGYLILSLLQPNMPLGVAMCIILSWAIAIPAATAIPFISRWLRTYFPVLRWWLPLLFLGSLLCPYHMILWLKKLTIPPPFDIILFLAMSTASPILLGVNIYFLLAARNPIGDQR